MKKYFLAMAAIVLAIGFSAFTTTQKVKKSATVEETYNYWYTVEDDVVGELIAEDKTKSDMINESITTCADDILPACVVGSDDQLTEHTSPVPSLVPDNHVLDTENP